MTETSDVTAADVNEAGDTTAADANATSDARERRDDPRQRIEAALREVRREGWKAALVYAIVDAALVFLAVNLLLATVDPGWLPGGVTVPAALADPVADAVGLQTPVGVPGSAAVAGAVGLLAFVGETWFRVRQPLVEQFEAVNPGVAEALRTARDAVADDADTPMAARLYSDVLDRLGESSGVALVDGRRVAFTAAMVVVLSLATLQMAVIDVSLFDGPQAADDTAEEAAQNYTGLRDGDEVLGASESVSSGDEEITAAVESTGGGRDVDEDQQFPETGGGGSASAGGVDSQQAGFSAPDRVEEAELVREYNRRIREETDEE